ncbi:MAG: hypothetical protein IJS80_05845 [Lachnospiraceae bacterium]|nr:hypothetical protein [Lachnospiraceae bacterium]
MLVHENAGVAGYSEAFMYGQSGKQASIRSGYLITDVLGIAIAFSRVTASTGSSQMSSFRT